MRAYYERIQRNDPDRKKIAVVATAHYLVRVMWALLKNGTLWKEPGVKWPLDRGAFALGTPQAAVRPGPRVASRLPQAKRTAHRFAIRGYWMESRR